MTMKLVFEVERAVESRIPLDVVPDDFTLSELTDAIQSYLGGRPTPDVSPRPVLWLAPGLGGDEPRLAAFRRTLSPTIEARLLHLLEFETGVGPAGDLLRITQIVVAQITEGQPTGPLCLAGHSFGGIIAFAAAVELQKRGRRVAFLSVLDTSIDPHSTQALREQSSNWNDRDFLYGERPRGPGASLRLLGQETVAALCQAHAYGLLYALVKVRTLRRTGGAVYLKKVLLERLRARAVLNARLEPFEGLVTVFRAVERRVACPEPAGLGWAAYADKTHTIELAGTHWSIFDAPNLDDTTRTFAKSMMEALNGPADGAASRAVRKRPDA